MQHIALDSLKPSDCVRFVTFHYGRLDHRNAAVDCCAIATLVLHVVSLLVVGADPSHLYCTLVGLSASYKAVMDNRFVSSLHMVES